MQLTERIYQELFQSILEGEFQPGSRFLTEQEAIARFGVSRITIRRAFGMLESRNVISRKPKLGSVVNTTFSASSGKITKIGAVVPVAELFTQCFLATLCGEAAKQDIITVLEPATSGQKQNDAVIRLVMHGVRDLVIWGLDRGLNMDLFFRLRILGVNLVFFDRIAPGKIADYVCLDHQAAMHDLLEIAVGKNIRNIFYADTSAFDIDTSNDRRRCCRNECQIRGLNYSEEIPSVFPPDSAVVAVNDPTALEFSNCGVPVFSIDGTAAARQAGIISYRQPMVEMAQCCFKALRQQRRLGECWRANDYRITAREPFQ